jgi:hypothetical protein
MGYAALARESAARVDVLGRASDDFTAAHTGALGGQLRQVQAM